MKTTITAFPRQLVCRILLTFSGKPWDRYPVGFSDAQFPNLGYTYIINLGSPFVMQVGEKKIPMKTYGFLPRYNAFECFHKPGNHLFGIKFRVSPVIFQKKIDFSEYKGYIFPLSYLLDQSIIDQVKKQDPLMSGLIFSPNTFFPCWHIMKAHCILLLL